MESKSMDVIGQYQPDDEIDLFELFSSLFQQWLWLVGITVLGVLLSVIIALSIPKKYEVTAQIAVPNTADVTAISVRGYGTQTASSLFKKLHQNLTSGVELGNFISTGQWGGKLYPEGADEKSDGEVVAKISDDFSVEQLMPQRGKDEANDPSPTLLALTMWSVDEQAAVDFLNNYIGVTNTRLVALIKEEGIKSRALEIEKVRAEILISQHDAGKRRRLTIQKMEEANQTKINTLSQSIDLLIKKSLIDEKSRLAVLDEALTIALKLKIKEPTTIDAMATGESGSLETKINVSTNARSDLFLMGSDYIQAQIKNLRTRKQKELFIQEIASIKKQIAQLKEDKILAALKTRKSDDPYIEVLPALLKKLNKLESLTFDFSGVQLYRWDKKASIDGKAEKPKCALIVAVGGVLSAFVAIFVALIVGAVKRRKAVADV